MLSAEKLSLAGRLDGVSAALETGKVTAICGPNGAGKSTLLSCLAGTELPQAGRVMLGQDDLNRLPARVRGKRLGYLPQAPEIAWDMAAEALVRLGRLPHRDRGDTAVERADITISVNGQVVDHGKSLVVWRLVDGEWLYVRDMWSSNGKMMDGSAH